MQVSPRISNNRRRPSSSQGSAAQSSSDATISSGPLQQPDSNVMSLVYPDGRVMTIQLQEQFS